MTVWEINLAKTSLLSLHDYEQDGKVLEEKIFRIKKKIVSGNDYQTIYGPRLFAKGEIIMKHQPLYPLGVSGGVGFGKTLQGWGLWRKKPKVLSDYKKKSRRAFSKPFYSLKYLSGFLLYPIDGCFSKKGMVFSLRIGKEKTSL
jgi:hypothetical protein